MDRILVASLEQDFNNDKRITITIPANDSLQVEIAKDKNGMIITNVFYIFDELRWKAKEFSFWIKREL